MDLERDYKKEWNQKHREENKERTKRWNEQNPNYQKEYYERKRDELLTYQKEYRRKKKEMKEKEELSQTLIGRIGGDKNHKLPV